MIRRKQYFQLNLDMIHQANRKLGFSMLELSIVIIIIGVLTIAVSSGSRIVSQVKIASAQSLTKSSPISRTRNLLVWYETTMNESFDSRDIDSGMIQTWHNLNPNTISTNKNNATIGDQIGDTSNNMPRYVVSSLNGLPSLNFNSSLGNFLRFNGTALANSDYSVFVVEQRNSNSTANYFISGNTSGSTANTMLSLGYRTDTIISFSQLSNTVEPPAISGYSSPTIRIHTFRFGSTVGKDYYLNGQFRALTSYGSPSAVLNQGLVSYLNAQIGRYLNSTCTANSNCYNGNIGEIIIFSRYVNDDERLNIEQYLGEKWGVRI